MAITFASLSTTRKSFASTRNVVVSLCELMDWKNAMSGATEPSMITCNRICPLNQLELRTFFDFVVDPEFLTILRRFYRK